MVTLVLVIESSSYAPLFALEFRFRAHLIIIVYLQGINTQA